MRKKKDKSSAEAVLNQKKVARSRGQRTKIKRHFFASAILVLCAIFSLASVVSIYASLQIIGVTHTLRVNGVLQAVEQSTPVKHNRGGILNKVFVTEGEIVREGQILASLNTDDIRDELHQARQDVARLLLRARCLRAMKDELTQLEVPDALKQVLGQLQQVKEMHRETRACNIALDKLNFDLSFEVAELRAAKDIAFLYERLTQTNQLINKTGRKLDPFQKENTAEDLDSMKTILRQSVQAKEARLKHTSLKTDIEKKRLSRQLAYDQELSAISDLLANAQSELTEMENLMRDKFIYASTSGRVQRMRIGEGGRRIAAGAYVLEIAPLTTDFEVTSRINVAQAPNLGVGQVVHVKLSGGLPKPIWVPAKVDRILRVSENNRQLSIRLAREDLNKRDLLLGDNSLNGLGERSEALISINSETAWQSLTGTVRSMFNFGYQTDSTKV